MSKPPPGILAPLAETRFGLEGDELARLEQLRREKQEQLRKGELDHEREIGTPAAARPKEPPAMKPAGPPRSKPGPKPKGEERPTTGLEALTAATRRVYDVFQELAPDGCRPVRQAEVADRLNVTCPAVAQHVQKMRAAGVYLDGWTASYWGARSIEARPKADPAAATPAEQSVLDACERLAPGGSRPLPHAEIAESLGVTKSAVGYLVRSLRRKNLYREGWVIQHGYKLTRPRPPKPAVNADTPEPSYCAAGPALPPAPDARDSQVGGDHYTRLAIQPWDVIEATATPEGVYWFFTGNALKYLMRADRKGGLQDLRKARHYLDRLVSLVEQGKATFGAVRAPGEVTP